MYDRQRHQLASASHLPVLECLLHRLLPHAARRSALIGSLLLLGVFGVLLSNLGGRPGASPIFASAVTPGATGTIVQTPVGLPPGPPTSTPTSTASPAPSTPIATPSSTAASGASRARFTLDAARVSKPNNKGDRSGLSAVKPGSTVWLMMYYTVHTMPGPLSRTTTYEVDFNGRAVFKAAFKTRAKPTELGHLSRYTVYVVPANLPYGHYVYRASLTIGRQAKSRAWKFQIARQEKVATSGRP